MLADILFTILMLIPPAILWIMPKTRRNNGNWLIARKTVPLGIIALYWSDELLSAIARMISERQERDIEISIWIPIVISLIAAFLVIIPGGLFIRRKFGTEKKYNPGPSILLFFLLLLPAFIVSMILSFACSLFEPDHKGEWRTAWLPKEGNTGIAFQEQPIHPVLAEYNYRIRFSRDGAKTYRYLLTNTGGRTLFNLYRLKDGRLMFRDKDWDYLVDVQGPECRVFLLELFEDRLYAAQVPNMEIDTWSGPFRKNDEIVMEMGDQTVPAEDVTGIFDGMTYYGCIEDRFYPTDQKPEQQISKTIENWPGKAQTHQAAGQTSAPAGAEE